MGLHGISCLVVEYIVAIDVTRVRFPADAVGNLVASGMRSTGQGWADGETAGGGGGGGFFFFRGEGDFFRGKRRTSFTGRGIPLGNAAHGGKRQMGGKSNTNPRMTIWVASHSPHAWRIAGWVWDRQVCNLNEVTHAQSLQSCMQCG